MLTLVGIIGSAIVGAKKARNHPSASAVGLDEIAEKEWATLRGLVHLSAPSAIGLIVFDKVNALPM
jgi:hypothetical protein